MTRKFTATTIQTTPHVDAESLRVLGEAEKQFRGQVPDDSESYRQRTAEWLENKPKERGGPAGPEPTRFGDWERKGRCFDF